MFKKDCYIERRNRLRKKIKSGLVLIPGNSEVPVNYPANTGHFRQDSNFLYFFGLNQPDYVGVLDVEADNDCIYGNDYSLDDIIWMGNVPSLREQAEQVGITSTYSLRELQLTIQNAVRQGRKIHFLPQYRAANKLFLQTLLGIDITAQPDYVSRELLQAVVSLREIKTHEEVEEIERACDIGYEMHTTAMRICREHLYERDIAGAIEGVALSRGAGVSFHSIVSQHGETLHNHNHAGKLENGRLLLIDAGAETVLNYCGDNTRTFPVSGKFSPLQRDVYSVVVGMIDRAMALVKPGVAYKNVHLEAMKVLVDGLKEIGLMKGSTEDAVAAGAGALFMPHGLGHQMGLDVHDMEGLGEDNVGYDQTVERSDQFGLASLRMGKMLRPGHVITVEPGIYFIPALLDKWQGQKIHANFIRYDKVREMLGFGGIRIEDDVLITENGRKILGKKRIPYTAEQVETFMQR